MCAAPQPYGRAARLGPGGLRGRCAAAVDRGAVGTGAPGTAADLDAELPGGAELLAACCGHIGDHPDDHPVTRGARRLAELHLDRRTAPVRVAEIDCRRREIVVDIDRWVGERTCSPAHARSLGAAVDGLAAAQVRATVLLRQADAADDERVRAAWFVVGSIADWWAELVAQHLATVRPHPRRPDGG
ncbi:DUF4254 domain-containing protein [Nocardia veterana]|uniref:DUF4254 domain-containing protein n=2 Tax=Nocardia veterana TaxID=132249 RepID=A0A7X6M450_9NOCA|nr:DUF4254 domain-containing protein [Nocardia veterana]NKY89386.1 DUF4254 domain-containing protein [Nocardia veterana]